MQQSPFFRVWTSRALMIYFRRILLFLVVKSRQDLIEKNTLSQEQPTVSFSDAEDDDEVLMINDQRELTELLVDRKKDSSKRSQISTSKPRLFQEYVDKELSQGFNNSMNKAMAKESIDKSFSNQSVKLFDSAQLSDIEQFEVSKHRLNQGSEISSIRAINNTEINENRLPDDAADQRQSKTSYYRQIDTPLRYESHFNSTNAISTSSVSSTDENRCKIHSIPFYSLVDLVSHYFLCSTRLIMKFYHINHHLLIQKTSLHRPMMKMIFTKNTKLHFLIFFIKQKVCIHFDKKINYTLCSYLNPILQSSPFVH